jgi:hypothetical protein
MTQKLAAFVLVASTFASVFATASVAHADVVPPDEEPCTGKVAGDSCSFSGKDSTCVTSKCTRRDYASWDRDASDSPPTREVDCLKCGESTSTGTADAAPVADGGTTTAPAGKGGCAVASPHARRVGPWALAALPAALLALARRRRPSRG